MSADYRSIGCVRLLAAVLKQRTEIIAIAAHRARGLVAGDVTVKDGRRYRLLEAPRLVETDWGISLARVEVLPAPARETGRTKEDIEQELNDQDDLPSDERDWVLIGRLKDELNSLSGAPARSSR